MAAINYGRPHASVVTAYRLMSALPGTHNSSAKYGFTILGGACVQCYESSVCV